MRVQAFGIAALCVASAAQAPASAQGVIYVNASATGANDGTSWTTAFVDLQGAMASAVAGEQVWVAAGTYRPTATTDRRISFRPRAGVELYGGFAGGETLLAERDVDRNPTILSGEIGAATETDNSYHVVVTLYAAGVVIDGFTITRGHADLENPGKDGAGGGILGEGSTVMRHCVIRDNQAVFGGGACYVGRFDDCVFEDNRAELPGSISAGGAAAGGFSFTGCVFRNNKTLYSGGAVYTGAATLRRCTFLGNATTSGSPFPGEGGGVATVGSGMLINCWFDGNSTLGYGGGAQGGSGTTVIGGVFLRNSAGHGGGVNTGGPIIGCVFTDNAATHEGGGLLGDYPQVEGSTFTRNRAARGGAIASSLTSGGVVSNSIAWGDTPDELYSVSPPITVSYSDIQGGYAGTGNIDVDPLFLSASTGDLRLRPGSPCIDAGANASVLADDFDLDGDGDTAEPLPLDLGGRVRFIDDPATPDTGSGASPIVDMGAYEYGPSRQEDYLVGEGNGPPNPHRVRVLRSDGYPTAVDFLAYASGTWGVNVASGDLDGGGTGEIVTGPGPGPVYGPAVRGFGRTGTALGKINYYAYGTLKYGVNVITGPIDADTFAEIVTGAGPGVVFGPHVRGWNYDGTSIAAISAVSYFAYATLRYGVLVGEGDVDGDGYGEILTGPGPSAAFAPAIRGWNYDGSALAAIAKINIWAFPAIGYGANVAGGDVDGDAFDEIAAAPGPGPGSSFPARFRGFDYDATAISALPGFDLVAFAGTTYGGRLGLGDPDGDGRDNLLAGAGADPTADSTVKPYRYDGSALASSLQPFTAFGAAVFGVDVAGANLAY